MFKKKLVLYDVKNRLSQRTESCPVVGAEVCLGSRWKSNIIAVNGGYSGECPDDPIKRSSIQTLRKSVFTRGLKK